PHPWAHLPAKQEMEPSAVQMFVPLRPATVATSGAGTDFDDPSPACAPHQYCARKAYGTRCSPGGCHDAWRRTRRRDTRDTFRGSMPHDLSPSGTGADRDSSCTTSRRPTSFCTCFAKEPRLG